MGIESKGNSLGNPDLAVEGAVEAGLDPTDDAPTPVDCPKRQLDAGQLGFGNFVCSRGGCEYRVDRKLFSTLVLIEPCQEDALGLAPLSD